MTTSTQARDTSYRIRESRTDQIFNIINYTILAIFLVVILYPLIYVVSASFSNGAAVIAGKVVLWPVDFSLEAYIKIFNYDRVWTGYANSVFYAVVGTTVNVVLTLFAAYPLSRSDFYGRNIFVGLFIFTMFFNGGLIPSYLLVKDLGMLNTRAALIIPQAISVWNLIIAMTYFRVSIPSELLEAAQLDGCNDFQYFVRILLPLSTPIIAVLSLFYAISHWNQFFAALISPHQRGSLPVADHPARHPDPEPGRHEHDGGSTDIRPPAGHASNRSSTPDRRRLRPGVDDLPLRAEVFRAWDYVGGD
ncbi:MAG: carbohydrate ABC transporter permease [Caldilineaceae bacterium]